MHFEWDFGMKSRGNQVPNHFSLHTQSSQTHSLILPAEIIVQSVWWIVQERAELHKEQFHLTLFIYLHLIWLKIVKTSEAI